MLPVATRPAQAQVGDRPKRAARRSWHDGVIQPIPYDLFADAGDAVHSLLPPGLGEPRLRSHRYGLKVWFAADKPAREHYEAQVIGVKHVPAAEFLALEIGFHAEHPKLADNEAVLAHLLVEEKRWRRSLGRAAEGGEFLGRPGWIRVSETWPDPDLGDASLALDMATRLVDYITAVEPALRRR